MNSIRLFVQAIRGRFGNFPIFFVVGGTCTVLDLIILFFLTDILHFWYVHAGIISFVIVSAISFVLHKTISFDNKHKNYRQQYSKFLIIVLIGMTINNGTLYMLTHFLGVWYIFSRLVASFVAMFWNYFVNARVVFSSIICDTKL